MLAVELRRLGHEAMTTRDSERVGEPDDAQMSFATGNRQILITHNRKDFILLHRAWVRWAREWDVDRRHSGILVIRDRWTSAIAARHIHELVGVNEEIDGQLYEASSRDVWMAFER